MDPPKSKKVVKERRIKAEKMSADKTKPMESDEIKPTSIRLTKEAHDAISRAARIAGKPLAVFIREVAEREARSIIKKSACPTCNGSGHAHGAAA